MGIRLWIIYQVLKEQKVFLRHYYPAIADSDLKVKWFGHCHDLFTESGVLYSKLHLMVDENLYSMGVITQYFCRQEVWSLLMLNFWYSKIALEFIFWGALAHLLEMSLPGFSLLCSLCLPCIGLTFFHPPECCSHWCSICRNNSTGDYISGMFLIVLSFYHSLLGNSRPNLDWFL